MRKHALLRVILWAIIALILSAFLVFFLFNPFEKFTFSWFASSHYEHSELYLYGNGEVDSESIQQLEIHWIGGQVHVLPYDGQKIQMSEEGTYSEKDALHYYVDHDKLIIQFAKSQRWKQKVSPKNLTVLVPMELYFKDIDIETTSANIDLENIQTQQLDLETVSGNLTLKNIQSQEVSIETVSGQCHLQGTAEWIDTETVSGHFTFVLSGRPSKIDTESVSGDIDLYLEDNDGFTAKMDSVSGKLSCDFASKQENKRLIYKNGSAQFNFDSVSGNVHIYSK